MMMMNKGGGEQHGVHQGRSAPAEEGSEQAQRAGQHDPAEETDDHNIPVGQEHCNRNVNRTVPKECACACRHLTSSAVSMWSLYSLRSLCMALA